MLAAISTGIFLYAVSLSASAFNWRTYLFSFILLCFIGFVLMLSTWIPVHFGVVYGAATLLVIYDLFTTTGWYYLLYGRSLAEYYNSYSAQVEMRSPATWLSVAFIIICLITLPNMKKAGCFALSILSMLIISICHFRNWLGTTEYKMMFMLFYLNAIIALLVMYQRCRVEKRKSDNVENSPDA